jgi:L-fuculokinase
MPVPVIAVFDIGRTNKKLFLFNDTYDIVFEHSKTLDESSDEDGFSCEDIDRLTAFVKESLSAVLRSGKYDVRAVNFSAYGATFVYIDDVGKPVFPIFNYLKEYPVTLKEKFYRAYGGEEALSLQTSSPVLGSLNSGMQVYRLKNQKPNEFASVKHALHLPQFLSYLISGKPLTEITSLGCHTNLLNFTNATYHHWVVKENIQHIFPEMVPCDHVEAVTFEGSRIQCGVGIHDSSAALIPYFSIFQSPFLLISTGTWSISMNPFNDAPLTADELRQDCLCYMSYSGKPVKASRLFAGHEYEHVARELASCYDVPLEDIHTITFNYELIERYLKEKEQPSWTGDLSCFKTVEEAYHSFMLDLVRRQCRSTGLVMNSAVTRIFVDGGFARNNVFMNLLPVFFPQKEVYAAFMSQGTALGAAMAIHNAWNKLPIPLDRVKLVRYRNVNSTEPGVLRRDVDIKS